MRGRWFFVALGLVALALATTAFAPSLLDGSQRRAPITPLVSAHAALMTSWLLLFLVQAWLGAHGRFTFHRRLGVASLALAAGVVSTGCLATVAMVRRGFDLSGDLSRPPASALDQAVFQFGSMITFVVLVALAIVLRHRPGVHKRLMALAVIHVMMAAPLAHLVGHFELPGLILPAWGVAVVAAFVVYDRRSRGRIHPATVWGGMGLVIFNNVQFAVIGPSLSWQRVLTWIST